MDENGYPSDDELLKIEKWPYEDGYEGLMEFVHSLWTYPDYYVIEIDPEGVANYTLHTGGWSGNEDIMEALHCNILFWAMCWFSSVRGGHFVFKIPENLMGKSKG